MRCWTSLNRRVLYALAELQRDYPPTKSLTDKRYKDEEEDEDPAPGKPKGTHHFAVGKPTGHPDDDAVMESNMRENKERLKVCTLFTDRITALNQPISMIFEGVDRAVYHFYLQAFERFLQQTPLDMFQTTERACFTGLAIVHNERVQPHRDVGDHRHGWAAMCCFGGFEGGELCLPSWR